MVFETIGDCKGIFRIIDRSTGRVVGSFSRTVKTKTERECFDYVSGATLALADEFQAYDFMSSAGFME